MIKIINISSTLIIVTCLLVFSPIINLAFADSLYNLSNLPNLSISAPIMLVATTGNIRESINIAIDKLTPQERQKIQAIRQRRNQEIIKILDNSQLQNFTHNLHTGKNQEQALAELELSAEQRNLINAIIDFTNLRLQKIVIAHDLLDISQ